MKKLKQNPIKEQKERIIYALFYFFIISFLLKTAFGFMTDSKSLLVSGIFSLFGILTAVVTLMRLGLGNPSRSFNHGKLESMVMFGIAFIIATSTIVLVYSVGHMVIFHTLYPPQLLGAWVAASAAAGSLGFMEWIGTQIGSVPEGEGNEINFVLQTDIMFSILAVIAIVLSRMGITILDYASAIFASFFIIIYSAQFLYTAFKGLMDASCDKLTISSIEKCIRDAQGEYVLGSLRVNKVGQIIEIIAFLTVSRDLPIKEVTARMKEIKEALMAKFTKPHEMFIGIVSNDRKT